QSMEKLLNYAARFRSTDQVEVCAAAGAHRLLRRCRKHSSEGLLRSNRRGLRTGRGTGHHGVLVRHCGTRRPPHPPPLALTPLGERMETSPDLIDFTAGGARSGDLEVAWIHGSE